MSEFNRGYHEQGAVGDITIDRETCAETLINQEGLAPDVTERVGELVDFFSEIHPEFTDLIAELSEAASVLGGYLKYFQDGIVSTYHVITTQFAASRVAPLEFQKDIIHTVLLQTSLDHKEYDEEMLLYIEEMRELLAEHNEYLHEYISWCTKRSEYEDDEIARTSFICGALVTISVVYMHAGIYDLSNRYVSRN